MTRLWIAVVLVPLYLLVVKLTSGNALIGLRHHQQVWTVEYLVPAIVALALAALAWRSTPTSRPGRLIRALGIVSNLTLSVLLTVGTVMLWGEHM